MKLRLGQLLSTGLLLLGFASSAHAAGARMPDNISTYGEQIDYLYNVILYITGFFFVVVEVVLLAFIVMYRRGAGRKVRGDVHGHNTLEIVWTTIPALILAWLALAGQRTWAEIRNTDRIPQGAIPIQVSARQFAWDIRYAGPDGVFGKTDRKLIIEENPFGIDPDDPKGKDDVVMDSEMCVPVNKPVRVSITSKDVIHSFYLPNVRIKQDAVPGMNVEIWFQTTRTTADARKEWRGQRETTMSVEALKAELKRQRSYASAELVKGKDGTPIVEEDGLLLDDDDILYKPLQEAGVTQLKVYPEFDFQIACAELCGNGHYKMKGTLLVETVAGFKQWLAENAP